MLKKLFIILLISHSLNAEVITDGTLGQNINLPGPDFQITPDLGQQHGGNLFHSFQDFNLNSLESATFSGFNNINNVISRVTGGNPSNIDGLIRSTIPNADFYFLNPYGIMFGPNARLDVQGSFHVSTADYLRLGENGRFDARNPNGSLLTVAPIASFGFLDNPHGKIEITGQRTDLENPRALLQVPDGKSLSLIGGDIYLSQGVNELPLVISVTGDNSEQMQKNQYLNQNFNQLYAPGGYVNLAAIKQAGELAVTKNGLNTTAKGGTINLEQEAYISTTGENGGNIFIRAGQFSMDNSTIHARTLGLQDGGVVDIQADNIELNNLSKIQGGTENLGDGTDILLSANETIYIAQNSPLNTRAGNQFNLNQQVGNAGHIHLQAQDIKIEFVHPIFNERFSSDTFGSGRGGDMHFNAENRLDLLDSNWIETATWGDDEFAGNAGDVYASANILNVEGSILATGSRGSGDAGKLTVKAGQLYMGKTGISLPMSSWFRSYNRAKGGNGGKIIIQADDMLMEGGASITTVNQGSGNAGDIDIQVDNQLVIRGSDNKWGKVTSIYATSAPSNEETQAGNAGNIHIRAKELKLEDGGRIDASTKSSHPTSSSGRGGNIVLEIEEALILSGVNFHGETANGFGSVIASRTKGNSGDAGNIQIKARTVSILEGASIETGSDNRSHGGNIQIKADKFILISGDASQITLKEPLWSQDNYLSKFNPQTYNQSTSGVYSNTIQADSIGNSGNIELSTPQLELRNHGKISTTSEGEGQAGQIILNVEKLLLNDNTLIRSNTDLVNQLTFDSESTRDNQLISLGTVVKTLDTGTGKAFYQINFGNRLFNFMPITNVADLTALKNLSEQIQMDNSFGVQGKYNGDIVTVADTGNGQSARFISSNFMDNLRWTKIDENTKVVLDKPDYSLDSVEVDNSVQLPYKEGTQIHVKDMGNGKAADFIYFYSETDGQIANGDTSRVKYYQVADIDALQQLNATTNLLLSTQVDVNHVGDDHSVRFIFDGNDWIRFNQALEIPDIEAQQNLIFAKPGLIANLPTGNTIYTGREWIDLGQTYRVNTLSERNNLNVKHGDLVKVLDTGNSRFDSFLYADGKWIKQVRGGDAGQIVINADSIQLTDGSKISTGSISGGGGSVTLNVDKLVYLNNSQVSISVKESLGSGGDLIINGSQFITMNNGKIIAQANEGQGGNIRLVADQFITSPNSTVSASSKLGVDGEVNVESLDMDMEGFLVVLSGEVMKASEQMKKPCSMRGSSFTVQKINGSPQTPYDYQPAQYLSETDNEIVDISKNSDKKLAFSTCKNF